MKSSRFIGGTARLWLATVLLLAGSGSASSPTELKAEFVVNHEWRLLSDVFPEPGSLEGFPVKFLSGGSLESNNLGPIDSWRIGSDGSLELLHDGRVSLTFRRVEDKCFFVSCSGPSPLELSCGGYTYRRRPSSVEWCRSRQERPSD